MANRKVIDKGMIEDFGHKFESERIRDAFYMLSDHTDDITFDLSQSNPLINVHNVELILGGDFANNTQTINSELDVYLAVKSAQIELNSIGPMEKRWKVWLERLKTSWANRNKRSKKAIKKAKKLEKKTAKELTLEQLAQKKEKPYTLMSLKDDFFDRYAEHLTNLTLLYNQPRKIRLLAKDEFGFRINIYPVMKHDYGIKIWDANKNRFITKDIDGAKATLEKKNQEIKDSIFNGADLDTFYSIIRIFKSLYYNVRQSYNYEFIESIIASCPNTLFKTTENEKIYDVFIKVLNYLNNANLGNIRSIYNQDKTVYEQNSISLYAVKNFLKDLNEYLI